MQASLIIATNIFKRDAYTTTAIKRKRRISSLAPKIDKPFICLLNGAAVLRKDWSKTLKDGDVCVFLVCPPQGGGGSNPLQAVLMIGLSLVAPGIGTAISSTLGFGGVGTLGASIFSGIISIAGKALIGSMFGTPQQSSSQKNAEMAAPSPTYTISAQGNASRLGDVIPVVYGTMKVYPNYAAEPYSEYSGNEQYLYQLFCIGQGHYDIDGIYILDTPISSFPEVDYQIVAPGGTVTLFPSDVNNSEEVSGQEAVSTTVPLGPFVANSAGTLTNAIAIDVTLPRGLYYANDEGGLDNRSVQFSVEAQGINDAGSPTTGWFPLGLEFIQLKTNTPQRRTYKYSVPSGRYQVRLMRTSTKDTDARTGNDLLWAGLRAYIPGNQQYGNVTMLAMRMRATNSLSGQSSRKINCIVTRKLPIFNGTNWSAPTRTRSIAWALADICRAEYGAKYQDIRIDLAQLLYLDATWSSRGDTFNGIFDNGSVLWEALTLAAKAGRAKPYQQSGVIRFVRDEPKTLPVAMFNMQNIVQGSVNVQYVMPTEDTADVIEVRYFNEATWNWDFINCALPDSASTTPAKVTLFGVTNRDQAWREGMYLAAVNKYRRSMVNLGSEMDGFIPSFGDLVAISHDRPQWGQSGELIAYDAFSKTITTSEPLVFTPSSNHYISFRLRDGSVTQIYSLSAGSEPNKAVLDTILDFVPDLGNDRERTYYAFGVANQQYKRALLSSAKPRDLMHCDLGFVIDDARVYSADLTSPPPTDTYSNLPVVITRPLVKDISFTHDGTPENPALILSWSPAVNADHYILDLSTDNQTWSRVADTTATSLRLNVPIGDVWIRIAAVGLAQGNFVSTGKIVTGLVPPPQAPVLQLAETFTGTKVSIKWAKVLRAISTRIEIRGAGNLVRTVTTTQSVYEYTAEDAVKDGGPWRELVITGYSMGATGDSGGNSITVTNPQMGALSGVRVYAGYLSGFITYPRPTTTDFAGVQVHLSTTNNFTPDNTTLIYDGTNDIITLTADVANDALVGGATYYIRIGAYDTFGKDSINYGANQYQFTALSANIPSNQELLDALNDAIQDPNVTNSLVLTADRFALRYSVEGTPTDIYPFVLGQVNGQSVMGISADVIINGNVSVDNLVGGTLAASENIIVGDGGMVLSGSGALTVYDGPSSVSNRDYATFTAGKLTFQRYRDGEYKTYKSVSHIEQGVANSGETVEIPGYFDTQPKIQVSLNALKSFDYAYASQSQSWLVGFNNLREITPASGRWQFDAFAELNLSATSGTISVNSGITATSSNSYFSPVQSIPNNTSQLTLRIAVRSYRGTGTNTSVWAYRQVTWKAYHRNNGGAWILKGTKTVQMGAQISNAVVDSIAITGISGTGQEVYIEYTAADAGGTFSLGGDVYDYATATVSSNGNSATSSASGGSAKDITNTLVMSSYSPPSGFEIYNVIYSFQYKATLWYGTKVRVLAPNVDRLGGTASLSQHYYTDGSGGFAINYMANVGDVYRLNNSHVQYNGMSFSATYYSPTLIYARAIKAEHFAADFFSEIQVANASATVYMRSIQKNSAAVVNTFNFTEFTWQTSTAASLASGSLNWTAIGD